LDAKVDAEATNGTTGNEEDTPAKPKRNEQIESLHLGAHAIKGIVYVNMPSVYCLTLFLVHKEHLPSGKMHLKEKQPQQV
jgi:hypothetical protein